MSQQDQMDLNRRRLLSRASAVGLSVGFGLVTRPAFAERPMLTADGRVTECSNLGVNASNVAGRLSAVNDFTQAGRCALSRDTVEGPYFICSDISQARNITGDRKGEPMTLALRVIDQNCIPIPGAIVDVWCCDAKGNYSGHNVDPDKGVRVRGRREPDLPDRFLRGVLASDVDGIAEFDMIYPGYYTGRAVHVHFKVHVGNRVFLTSQALFPEEFNERIMALAPYNHGRSSRRVLNAEEPAFLSVSDTFQVSERASRLLAVLNLAVSV